MKSLLILAVASVALALTTAEASAQCGHRAVHVRRVSYYGGHPGGYYYAARPGFYYAAPVHYRQVRSTYYAPRHYYSRGHHHHHGHVHHRAYYGGPAYISVGFGY